ncbi:MAG: hypothetical protein U0736_08885 [Gemmataceae bacterium]
MAGLLQRRDLVEELAQRRLGQQTLELVDQLPPVDHLDRRDGGDAEVLGQPRGAPVDVDLGE